MIKKKISKILVPIDGSKNSLRGLKFAITLAKQFDSHITGVYVIHAQPHSEFSGIGTIDKAYKKGVKKIIAEAKLRTEKSGVIFHQKIIRGEIGFNIIKLAHGVNDFNMIVMGSRGRSSTKAMLFGSVSNYVVHTSKIPVVIVK